MVTRGQALLAKQFRLQLTGGWSAWGPSILMAGVPARPPANPRCSGLFQGQSTTSGRGGGSHELAGNPLALGGA
jgi:hypothetical protein